MKAADFIITRPSGLEQGAGQFHPQAETSLTKRSINNE